MTETLTPLDNTAFHNPSPQVQEGHEARDREADPPRPATAGRDATSAIISDYTHLFASTSLKPEWVIPEMIETASQALLYAKTGVGKSLLALDLAIRVASGASIFGQEQPARRTLYLDYENGPRALARRLAAMGYESGRTSSIDNSLFYYPFPDLLLDTPSGSQHLKHLLDELVPEFVIVDSLNQSAEGSEQSSDTYVAFQRFTSTLLRERGIASLRLDNTGKDAQKSARGSSKKTDDVETVWHLRTSSERNRVAATVLNKKDRLGTAKTKIELTRHTDPVLIHELDQDKDELSPGAQRVVQNLEKYEAPKDITVDQAKELLRDHGCKHSSDVYAEGVRHWKAHT